MEPSQDHAHPAPPGEAIRIDYVARPGLGWLSIKNFLLGLITLSIYRFWAKTNVRKHIWSSIHINGDPLEYTGTGKELFLGALLIFVIIGLPIILITSAISFFVPNGEVVVVIIYVFLLLGAAMLYGMAIYRARRYRLSRTLWRGIRGTLTGSSFSFSMLYFGAILLRSITMGWSTPAMNLNLQERLMRDMEFGNRSFDFRGPAGPLYKRYAVCWFLTPVVLLVAIGIMAALMAAMGLDFEDIGQSMEQSGKFDWSRDGGAIFAMIVLGLLAYMTYALLWTLYTVREMNLFAAYTTYDSARFRLNATVWSLVGLVLGNFFLILFTLGIAEPFVQQRVVRYLCDRLEVDGVVNVAAIGQSTAEIDRRGEGLVDALEIDAF